MFTLANLLAQSFDSDCFGTWFSHHATAAGSAIEQQFGNQAFAAELAGQALSLLIVDQALQGRTRLFQH
ncbi:hypothetical protein D3C76_1427630 [compost metagenome]